LSIAPESTVSFDQFATQFRRCQQAEIEKQVLEHRLVSTKISICLSSRLLRTGATVQRGLVDAFKHGDKTGFVSIYNTIYDIREACELGSSRSINRQHSFPEEHTLSLHGPRIRTASFMHQLSSQSRKDLLEILTQVRTNSQFLVDCITGLLPSQLSSFTTPVGFSAYGDTISSHSTARSRNSATFAKRATPNSIPFKEHAWALERSDPLSALLFNVFAVPLDWQPEESELRVDVWSSTCAKLLSSGDNKYLNFVGQVLSYWSTGSDWRARQKIELYLMDVLQKGAFLLENIESPVAHSLGVEPPDPLRTDAAEEFFESAVQTLFEVLDDSDAGLPSAALEFCNAVLNKLADAETRDRFLEFIFVQWFFSRYLYYALTFPEGQGLLLDFHISKEAREKLLSQIALRAQSQFYRVLHSVPEFSTVNTQVRRHVDSMIKRCLYSSSPAPVAGSINQNEQADEPDNSSSFLMLCAADVVTLLNVLFPKVVNSPSGSLSSNSTHPGLSYTQHSGPRRAALPAHWSGRIETVLERPNPLESIKQEHTRRSRYHQCADVIRFELSDLGETEAHPVLEHPSTEDWTLLEISGDRKSLTWRTPSGNYSDGIFEGLSDSGDRSGTVQPEEDREALHTAIQKLVNESENLSRSKTSRTSLAHQTRCSSLKQRFDAARSMCESRSDFLGAHYWWTASNQLMQSLSKSAKSPHNDSWILGPMLQSSRGSFTRYNTIIHECEEGLFTLSPLVEQLKEYSRNSIAGMTKLRNKMWYMTDVKNSMRYEDAKHVALALKTMVYPNLHRDNTNEYRSRNGSRYLGGSFLQKPEMQVMNVMKASTSQGGPNKLSDEQVELTRKWISHHGIDNFCRGEERIHRFCYEVKSSINKLVGDSMAETPVLWASELFQRERAKFEGSSNRSYSQIPPTPGARPSSISSEEALSGMPYSSLSFRGAESLRPSEPPSLIHQSQSSEKWKYTRKFEVDTLSSSGGSSGRAASSSTTESYTTFWSPSQTQAQSAASASSFQSRPPSMFSDAPAPRRTERTVHGKTAFLDDLRQTLTSLLLSDLGSPVWSCGSETDAWFIGFLNQTRVQRQMDKQARIQKFLAESEKSIHQRLGRSSHGENYTSHRRSSSAGPILISVHDSHKATTEGPFSSALGVQPANESAFSYKLAFSQLLDVFSRNANPYVKLGALRDLRALIVASLDRDGDGSPTPTQNFINSQGMVAAENLRLNRHSFTEELLRQDDSFRTPTSPAPESVDFDSHPSYDLLNTSESRIITAIKNILRELQPKTLFRDLQFVSAFVPSETLNKTDSGTAFLQFGLAALSLKEDVCASMVELADRIVSQELNRRHSQQTFDFISRAQDPIEDAARMWIITAKEGYPVAQRELAILYLTHPEILPRVTLPLTLPRDTFKAEMMYRRDRDSKFDPQSMCLALHWMQLSASGGDELARNRLREREEFESLV
jgi:chromatin assembly factor 1 subunit A